MLVEASRERTPVRRETPGAALARFLELRGRRIVEAVGVLWAQHRGGFYISLPYQLRIDPDPSELGPALRSARMAGVRYPTLTQPGAPSNLWVCAAAGYSITRVERKHRAQVRRGLEASEIRLMDPDELLALGLELNLQTMARQQRRDPELADPERWKRFVNAVRRAPGMSIAGAFVAGRLSSYIVLCRDGSWLHLMYKMSRTEDLIHRSNQALDFWALSEASKDPGIEGVTNGFESVLGGGGLRRYKENLGFQLVAHQMGMQLHPALGALLTNALAAKAVERLSRLAPQNHRLANVARVVAAARASRRSDGGTSIGWFTVPQAPAAAPRGGGSPPHGGASGAPSPGGEA